MISDDINNFASIGEEQASKTQQVSEGSQNLSELALSLNEYAKRLI